MKRTDNGYEELAAAIIRLAYRDYVYALRKIKHISNQSYTQARAVKIKDFKAKADSLERFFRSDWFMVLTKCDGELFIEQAHRDAERRKGRIQL